MSNSYVSPDVASIMGLFDTYIRWQQKNKPPRKYIKYHPSEFGRCLRSIQYKTFADLGYISVEPEEIPSDKQRLFDQGHNMHSRWSRYAESMEILRGTWRCMNPMCSFFDDNGNGPNNNWISERRDNILLDHRTRRVYGKEELKGIFRPERCICGSYDLKYEEVAVDSKELNFEGHADMVLDFSKIKEENFKDIRKTFNIETLPKTPIVVDMKTCNARSFDKLNTIGPNLVYRVQLLIYTYILDVEYGLIIYECKDDSRTASFKIEKDENSWNVVKNQALIMKSLLEQKRLPPPRPSSKSDYECKNCAFQSVCHNSKVWQDTELENKRKDFYRHLL